MILSRRNSNSAVARSAEVTLRTVPAACAMLVAAVSVHVQGRGSPISAEQELPTSYSGFAHVMEGACRIVTATPIIALGATCAIWAETLARRIA